MLNSTISEDFLFQSSISVALNILDFHDIFFLDNVFKSSNVFFFSLLKQNGNEKFNMH